MKTKYWYFIKMNFLTPHEADDAPIGRGCLVYKLKSDKGIQITFESNYHQAARFATEKSAMSWFDYLEKNWWHKRVANRQTLFLEIVKIPREI